MYELSFLFIGFLVGMALGCMLMAVLQRRATIRKEKQWRAEYQDAAKRPAAKVVLLPKREAPPMTRVLQAALSGVLFGFGLGAGLFEMWPISISFLIASGIGLFAFIRSCEGSAAHRDLKSFFTKSYEEGKEEGFF
jgi:hypothetical protein